MNLSWSGIRAGVRRIFARHPERKPRRPRCACKHPWCDHSARGCAICGTERPEADRCKLNREGKSPKRTYGLTVVAKAAGGAP